MNELEYINIEAYFEENYDYDMIEGENFISGKSEGKPEPIYTITDLKHLTAYEFMNLFGHKVIISAVTNVKKNSTYQAFGVVSSGYINSDDNGNFKISLYFNGSPHIEIIEGDGFDKHIIEVY